MSKTFLFILGIIVTVKGILGLAVELPGFESPVWYNVVCVVIGLIAVGVSIADKPKDI